MLTDRKSSMTNPKTLMMHNARSQGLGQLHKSTPGVNNRNSNQRLSLLDRLPLTDTGQEFVGGRSLPLLSNDLRRKSLLAQKQSAKTIRSQDGPENGLTETFKRRHTSFGTFVGNSTADGNGARPLKKHSSRQKFALMEPTVIIEETNSSQEDSSSITRRSSLGKYSRHRYTSTLVEEDDGQSDGDETTSMAGSMASGKSQTLRKPGAKLSQSGGRKKMSRRKTEGLISSSPLPWADGRSRRSVASLGLSHIIKFTIQGEAIALFRRSVRKVMHVLHWMVVLSKKDEKIESQLKTFFDMAQEIEDSSAMKHIEQQTGISFDPKYYRTSKQQFHLTYELRRCLTLVSDHRTEEMIQRVVTGLQHLEAFAEYPLHMQFKLAQVAWYQELPPKRMILRQGHKAENFYFILSGMGIAKQLVREEDTGRVLNRVIARLQKGQSFGEVALVHHQERAATVESVTHMQLLVVSREDFLDIFFATSDGGEPEHINFCRHIDFMKHWPVDAIQEEPQECLFHYFRRGTVVVQDSRANEWIYIVKSGTCMVLKKLKSVHPQKMWSPRSNETSLSFPQLGNLEPGPRIDSRISTARKRRSLLNIPHAISQEMLAYFKSFENTAKSGTDIIISPSSDKEENDDEKQKLHGFASPGDEVKQPEMSAVTPRSTDSTSISEGHKKRKFAMRSAPGLSRPSPRLVQKPKSIRGVLDAYMKSMETYITRIKERSIKHGNNGQEQSVWKERNADSCFVQLKKLRPRDSFGLEEIEFDDEKRYDIPETSVTLVSNGAEMIMISRKFFTKNCNDLVKQFIREKIRPFPSEETLQENLQHKVNWDLYRQHTVNEILTYLNDLKFQKIIYSGNSFLPCV